MALELIFSLIAVILASAGVLFYAKDRNVLKGTMMDIATSVERVSTAADRVVFDAREKMMTPEFAGAAMGHAIKEFFSGVTKEDESGTVISLPPDEAAFEFFQGMVATGVQVAMPMALEEFPVLLATSHSKKLAQELQSKSYCAKGVAKLPDGLAGIQALQKGMGIIDSSNPTVVKGMGYLQKGRELLQVYQEAKESGIIDVLKGISDDNGGSEPGGEPGQSTRSHSSAVGGGGSVDF